MTLYKALFLTLASTALAASAATISLPNTGANGAAFGSTDVNWAVYKFTDTGTSAAATGVDGLASYLSYRNDGTPDSVLAGAAVATPYSGWVNPASGAAWLSIAVNSSGQAVSDPAGGGGYAFLFNLGQSLVSIADLSQSVTVSLNLNGDNGFSAHLIAPSTGDNFVNSGLLLGSTASNFGSATAATATYTGSITSATQLLVLLSNDTQAAGNPGGILVRNFSATYAVIPEPSTYAAIFGVVMLGFVVWTRRKQR